MGIAEYWKREEKLRTMIRFYRLALKNIFRHKRRSVLTGLVMCFSVISILFAVALGEAFYNQLVNVAISTTTGHVQIFARGWDFDIISPMTGAVPKIKNPENVERIVARAPFFKSMGREIFYQGMLYDKNDRYLYLTVIGVEAEAVKDTLFGIRQLDSSFPKIEAAIAHNGILLSKPMFRYFCPTKDEEMYIIIADPLGMMDGIKVKFAGVVQAMPLFADAVSYISLENAQRLLKWKDGEYLTIKVFLTDKDKAEESALWLNKQFQEQNMELKVTTWRESGGFYYYIALLGRIMVFFLLLLLAAITAVSVSNTMLMSVRERIREIGTMSALGFRERDILGVFFTEAFLLSFISVTLGAIVGGVITYYFQQRGIIEGIALVVEGRLYPQLTLYSLLFSSFWILAVGTLAGIYPAYKAARLDPVKALRHI